MIAGCSPKTAPSPKPPEKPKTPVTVFSANGEASFFSEGENRRRLWHINWKNAEASSVGDSLTIGNMQQVNGEIFQTTDTKTFKADNGSVDKPNDLLTLTGNVIVDSQKQGSHLTCDKLVYNAKNKTFDARGNVSVKSKTVSVSGVPAAMADENLDEVASPDMFQEKNAVHK